MSMWFYLRGEEKVGPLPLSDLKERARTGRLDPTDPVLEQGSTRWRFAHSVEELFDPGDSANRPDTPEVDSVADMPPGPAFPTDCRLPAFLGYEVEAPPELALLRERDEFQKVLDRARAAGR